MILDGHIHIMSQDKNRDDFEARLKAAGIDGGIVMSIPPAVFTALSEPIDPKDRLDNLMYWTEGNELLLPLFWIDPTEADAAEQVDLAVQRGVAGFKIICSHHAVDDERAIPVYHAIAQAGKPILFHSGILWDGLPSSEYNRPANFEPLLEVPSLTFALAHVSWPWYDECIAVYGKIQSALKRRPELSCEMFIDLTPGTPKIYRREVLTKLYTVGYDIENNIFWGTDGRAGNFNADWAKRWIGIDTEIFESLGLSAAVQAKAFAGNLKRFTGLDAHG